MFSLLPFKDKVVLDLKSPLSPFPVLVPLLFTAGGVGRCCVLASDRHARSIFALGMLPIPELTPEVELFRDEAAELSEDDDGEE